MRVVKVTSADGIEYPIQFWRTSEHCWRVIFPSYVPEYTIALDSDEYTYRDPNDKTVLATRSLERAMSVIAEQITRTEF